MADLSKMAQTGFLEKLSTALRPVMNEQQANAAVALLLKPDESDVKILFVERVENSADPWSGQMALPGGKRDAGDVSLKQTVARETFEETGIDLLDGCRFLGVLSALESRPKLGIVILPFVVLLEREPLVKLNARELRGFVWLSLGEIVRGRGSVRFDFGEVPAFIVEDTVVWGLTFRVIEDFFSVLKSVGGSDGRRLNGYG